LKIQLFEVGAYRSYSFRFLSVGMDENEVYKEKVNTKEELVARIMNSAAFIKQERQDELRIATRNIAKRAEKCFEVDGGIYEHLL
jgi:uncharacterized protein YpuA (DUF1002 family)